MTGADNSPERLLHSSFRIANDGEQVKCRSIDWLLRSCTCQEHDAAPAPGQQAYCVAT